NLDDAGSLIVTKGKREQALRIFEVSRDVRQQLVARDSANEDFKRDLAVGLGNIASLLIAHGESMEALTACQQAIDLLDAINASANVGSQAQLTLGHVLEAYGAAAQALKRYDDALSHFDQSAAVFEEACIKTPYDAGIIQQLCRVIARFGSLLVNEGRYPDALNAYERAHKVLNAAYQANPNDWGMQLTANLEAIGYVLSQEQMPVEALKSYKEARGILEKLRQVHPENHELDETFAGTELALGKLFREQGESKDARLAFEQCSQILYHLRETGQLDDQAASWLDEADMQLRQPF
ncbi:MAG: hypothetical protein JO232_21385, partial [Verrucomicrobia bacterium]|nr:hypothetical protein [Verrucomicrobiota bacterium]